MVKLSQKQMVRLGLVLAGVVAVYVLFTSYSGMKGALVDRAEELGGTGVMGPLSEQGPAMSSPHSVAGNAVSVQDMQGRSPASQQTYTESVLASSELLPKGEIGASWAAVNPVGAEDFKGQNFLQAGYHTNTAIAGVAQTNRNASHDVRSEIPNPQGTVGPFLNSTIEPNPFKRGLEA